MPTVVTLTHQDKTNLKKAIIAVHCEKIPRRTAIARYRISGRRLSSAVANLEEHEKLKGSNLIEDEQQKQLTRWIDKHLNMDITKNVGKSYTHWELRESTYLTLSRKVGSFQQTVENYGVPRRSHARFSKIILESLNCKTIQMCKTLVAKEIITDAKLRSIVVKITRNIFSL